MSKQSRRPTRRARHVRPIDLRCHACTGPIWDPRAADRSIEDEEGPMPMHPECAERIKTKLRAECPVCQDH